jgi:hypothetical protein
MTVQHANATCNINMLFVAVRCGSKAQGSYPQNEKVRQNIGEKDET